MNTGFGAFAQAVFMDPVEQADMSPGHGCTVRGIVLLSNQGRDDESA